MGHAAAKKRRPGARMRAAGRQLPRPPNVAAVGAAAMLPPRHLAEVDASSRVRGFYCIKEEFHEATLSGNKWRPTRPRFARTPSSRKAHLHGSPVPHVPSFQPRATRCRAVPWERPSASAAVPWSKGNASSIPSRTRDSKENTLVCKSMWQTHCRKCGRSDVFLSNCMDSDD